MSGRDRETTETDHNEGVIAPDEQPSIFDPFRGRGGRVSTGLGLGLYIARQIALAHGGDVTAESSPEAGTTFTVRVPRTDAHAMPSTRPGPSDRATRSARVSGDAKARILVVEDDADARELFQELLEHEGYRTTGAGLQKPVNVDALLALVARITGSDRLAV